MYICLIWGPVFCHQTSPGCLYNRGPRPIRWPFLVSKSANCPGFLEAELQWLVGAIGGFRKKVTGFKKYHGELVSKISQVSKYPWENDVSMGKGSMEFKWIDGPIDGFEAPNFQRCLFKDMKMWVTVGTQCTFFFAEVAEKFGLHPANHPTPWLCFFLC